MTKAMRRFCGLSFFFVGLLAAVAATAQVSVSIPAVVVDKSGQTVHGLQKSDFEVRTGKNVSFDSLEEVPPLNLSGFADPVPVFILFDGLNQPSRILGQPGRAYVAQVLIDYLRQAADGHLPVTVLALSAKGILVIHDMSTDPQVFVAAMDRVSPKTGQPMNLPSAAGADFSKAVDDEVAHIAQLKEDMGRMQYGDFPASQLESLRVVGKMLQRSSKRKLLVWISGDFPVFVQNGELGWEQGYNLGQHAINLGTLDSAYQGALDSLNAALISVYPLPTTDEAEHETYAGEASHTEDGLKELAKRTGGSVLRGSEIERFPEAVAELCRQFGTYYILTLKAQATRKTNWIDSSIKVNKPGAKVTAANGFFLTAR